MFFINFFSFTYAKLSLQVRLDYDLNLFYFMKLTISNEWVDIFFL